MSGPETRDGGFREGVSRTMVFSHPNHELAVFGFLQRHRPWTVYLTDGGGEHRVAETRRGLASLGLLDRACFLGYTEPAFYRALLDRDVAFFREVAARTRSALRELEAEEVFCDAVEYYNPVHDLARPIAAAALAGGPPARLFEVPLVHQARGDGEEYRVQRFPPSRAGPRLALALTEEELRAKAAARDAVYTLLRAQMGDTLRRLPLSHLAREEAAPAQEDGAGPAPDQALRYERRGRLLQAQGEVERVITFREHYAPLAAALLGGA